MTDNSRAVDLRITAPPQRGFIVWVAGEAVAAFGDRFSLAEWLHAELGLLHGEREREARDLALTREAMSNVKDMPRVAREEPAAEPVPPRQRSRIFGGR
jgi:hypothetical protein